MSGGGGGGGGGGGTIRDEEGLTVAATGCALEGKLPLSALVANNKINALDFVLAI